MNPKHLLVAVALVGVFRAAVTSAQMSDSDQTAVERYRAAIRSAESGLSPRSIELAFAAIDSVRDALMREENGQSVLEALSDQDYLRLEQEMPGVLINREEVIFVAPDPDYFERLAAAEGDEADQDFFDALNSTYPDGVWPAYIEHQTDYSGCARFGSMSFVETYRVWLNFQNTHPARYVTAAKKEVDGLLEDLTQSTCACGDMAAVKKEFQRFIQKFPASPARRDVQRRLDAARAGRSNIRVNCVSG